MLTRHPKLLFDAILDAITAFKDYYIVGKHITLSEATLFVLAASRSIWFSVFGVNIAGSQALTHDIWIPVFWAVTVIHSVSFFVNGLKLRIVAMALYAFLWCLLAVLMVMAHPTMPNVLNFAVFSLLSVFIAVRLMQDAKE